MKQYFAYILIALTISSTQQEMLGQSGWFQQNSGTTIWLNEIEFVNENTGYIGSDGGFILKTTNAGTNWQRIQINSNGYFICLQFFDSNTGILSGYLGGRVFKTTNGGVTFDSVQTEAYQSLGMYFPSRDTGYVNTKTTGVFKTTNGGLNWFNVLSGVHNIEGRSYFISNNKGFITMGNSSGTLLKTTNGGINWIFSSPDTIILHDVTFVNSQTGFCCGRLGIFKTIDGGDSWFHVLSNPCSEIKSISFPTANTGYAVSWFSGSCNKMYKTTNGGFTWMTSVNPLFSSLYTVYFINATTGYAVSTDGKIIKTTDGGGNPFGITPISTEIPNQFSLSQNYPNPFNPRTVIRCMLPVAGMVTLKIYDALGREIETLVNEQLNAGTYEVEWSGNKFSSGVYYYQLTAENYKETKRMVLIK